MIATGGVQLLNLVVRNKPERLYKQAGWIVVCLAVDPQLSDAFVEKGGLPLLVHYACKDNKGYQEEAAWALANLSSCSDHALPLVRAGAMDLLLGLAHSSSGNVRMQAVWAIANLAVDEDIKEMLGELDAVRILLAALARAVSIDEQECVVQTTRAIANLAVTSSNRQRMLSHQHGLRQLIELGRSSSNSVQEVAARALVNLSYEADLARAIVQVGGLPPVIEMLKSSRPQVQQEAIWVIVNISVLPDLEGVLTVPELLQPLVALLQTGDSSVQEQAAWALGNVSSNAMSKLAIINLGALGALRALNAHHSSPDLQAASFKALLSLCQVLTPLSRRIYIGGAPSVKEQQRLQKGVRKTRKQRSPLSEGHSSIM